MDKKPGLKFFLEQVPALSKWKTAVPTYISQLLIFILTILFFYEISQKILLGAIIGQIIISSVLSLHYIILAKKSKNIRMKYKEKYKDFAGQKFWYHYQFWAIPIISAAFYFPLMLKTDYFLPSFLNLPDHYIYWTLSPWYIVIPIGFFIIILGFIISRSSKDYNIIIDHYLDVIYPDKCNLIKQGIYKIIRNPQYLSRGLISIGFGILANNIIAITVGFIHFLSYIVIIPAEDKVLKERFGKKFEKYKKEVPSLFPRIYPKYRS